MARHIYRLDDQRHPAVGPFNPLAGVCIRRAHAERTRRTLYRSDGSVAGTEDRQTLTLDTDGSRGPLYTARQLERMAGRGSGLLHWLQQLLYAAIWVAFITIGSALVLSIAQDLTHSIGLSLVAVSAFWCAAYVFATSSR